MANYSWHYKKIVKLHLLLLFPTLWTLEYDLSGYIRQIVAFSRFPNEFTLMKACALIASLCKSVSADIRSLFILVSLFIATQVYNEGQYWTSVHGCLRLVQYYSFFPTVPLKSPRTIVSYLTQSIRAASTLGVHTAVDINHPIRPVSSYPQATLVDSHFPSAWRPLRTG